MRLPHFMGMAAFAMLSSVAFGWTISGKVVTEAGQGLPGVAISSFNYAGIGTQSDATGAFSLSNETDALPETVQKSNLSVQKVGNFLNIMNQSGKKIKVNLLDALGKVAYQQEFNGKNMQIDMSKFSQNFMILRVTSAGASENYIISKKGVARNALKKEGAPMASLMFAKEGYANTPYQMSAEVETGVVVIMKEASEQPLSSSGVLPVSSSSESPVFSSSSQQLIVSCVGKTYQAGDHRMSVNVDGKNRTFIMHVPSTYQGDKAVPLVVDYHPVMGSGQGQLNDTKYKPLTDLEGVISLYPDGTKSANPSKMGPGWNVGPCCSDDDDVKFSREMIKMVEEKVCIDTKRVYAAGFSMGGGMSNHVACNMSDIYAAVAPAAMDLNTTNSATCNPVRPISIIMFRGTADNVCRYGGGDSGFNDGLNFLGAEKNFKFWAEKNGCTGSPTTNKDGCQEYSNCKDGTKVVLCTKQGGGHEQGDGNIGWPFLKSFTMP
ncbi:MAG: feruloyl esterase [Fibrobacter sp.]|nr:feruloyl esterase [Fibrobacter sp.]